MFHSSCFQINVQLDVRSNEMNQDSGKLLVEAFFEKRELQNHAEIELLSGLPIGRIHRNELCILSLNGELVSHRFEACGISMLFELLKGCTEIVHQSDHFTLPLHKVRKFTLRFHF